MGLALLGLFATVIATSLLAKPLGMAVLLVPVAGISAVLSFMVADAKLEIGADGVRARWLTKSQFIPYSEIDDVSIPEPSELEGTRVRLEGRRPVVIPISTRMSRGGRELAAVIAERILHAKASSGNVDEAPLQALDQGERAPRDWIDHLKSVGSGAAAGTRTAALPRDRLLGVLSDPRQPARTRLAAAIAVGSAEPSSRARILEVASAAVSPRFRVALEAAADPEREEELVELVGDKEDPTLSA